MALTQAGTKPAVEYPSTDGEPMAQNTKQYRYITTMQGGLAAMFRDRPDVFVAGDLFWYPIEGDNKTRVAPDVMVVFGRPKGDRDSYRQWEEDNIAPQVVFEILSPSNTLTELLDKSLFYERYGVQEYYIYDPDGGGLYGFVRDESGHLRRVAEMRGWVSPLLGVRFELEGGELVVVRPDGGRFVGYEELAAALEQVCIAVCTQHALVQPEGARGDLCNRLHIVRHEQDGASLALELADFVVAFLLEPRVADRQHLIYQQDVGVHMRGNGESQPHQHSRRVGADGRVDVALQFGELHNRLKAFGDLLAG
jgi:Uma2 family endonuclease